MATPEERRKARGFGAGLVVLALIAGVLVLTFQAQTGVPFAPTTTVRAEIDNVHSLSVNDQVRENSDRVGRVSDVQYVNDRAIVTLELEGNREVHADARAAIWAESALATKFVELYPGNPEAGSLDDGIIPVERTESSNDLYEVLDVFDEDTREAAAGSLRDVGGGVAGQSENLHDFLAHAPDILDNVGSVATDLSSDEADLPAVLRSGDRLTARFQGREREIASLVEQTDETLRSVSVDGSQPLAQTLNDAPDTLTTVRSTLEGLEEPLHDTESGMRRLASGADSLGRSAPDVRGVLREGVPVAKQVPDVAEQAAPAVEDLTSTASDLRPLAPRVTEALDDAQVPLEVLAPYAPEMGQLFVRGQSFVSEGTGDNVRYARLGLNPAVWTATGGLLEDPNFRQNEYPAPGEADTDRVEDGLPPGIPLGGGQ